VKSSYKDTLGTENNKDKPRYSYTQSLGTRVLAEKKNYFIGNILVIKGYLVVLLSKLVASLRLVLFRL